MVGFFLSALQNMSLYDSVFNQLLFYHEDLVFTLKICSLILLLFNVVFVRSNIAQSLYENNNNKKLLILCFLCSCLLCCQNVHDLIFKLILGYCAMRYNLFISMNLMWIEKNQDKSSCTAYNQITPGLYIYVGSDSNQWFSFIAFQDVFAPSVQ